MEALAALKEVVVLATRQALAPVLAATMFAYFAFHAVQGERGLEALRHLQGEIASAQATLDTLHAERMALEHRTALLRPDNLDPDMLDERARAVLDYSNPDDVIVLQPRRVDPPAVVAAPPQSQFSQ